MSSGAGEETNELVNTLERPIPHRGSQQGRLRGGVQTVLCGAARGVGHTDPVTKNKRPIPELRDIPVNDRDFIIGYDSDVSRNRAVRKAVIALADYLTGRGARVGLRWRPDDGDGKTGASSRRQCGATPVDIASATACRKKLWPSAMCFCPSATRKR